MNRDLLLGLIIPGPDRFEVRGWVRWLLGDPHRHMPDDPQDQARFRAIQELDPERLAAVQEAAVDHVARAAREGDMHRGRRAHDHLMQYLLTEAESSESVHFAAFVADTDRLLDMLDIHQDDLDDPEFLAAFQDANRDLAAAVAAALDRA